MADLGAIKRKGVTRRRFMGDVLKTACGVGLFGLGMGLYSNRASSLPAHYIRPPGALSEDEFNGACIRCGLCVRDCPYDMLYLGEVGQNIPTGTPYFIARDKACEMCEDIPCVAACPTNALDHELKDINDARMGLAVLVDQETCIAFLGLRCEVCYQICPIQDEAITLNRQHNVRSGKHALFIPVVHSERCTGCGKCEEACILEEAAIKVLPQHLAKGELGKHYRIGWEQKEQAGGALVSPDIEHKYNLPEGMKYEHGGEGLIENGGGAAPFSDNPLDTLNKKGQM
jgi:ferredoxin-type protein NapG